MVQVDINSSGSVKHITSYILAMKFISSLVTSPRRPVGGSASSEKEPFLSSQTRAPNQLFSLLLKKIVAFLH